MRNRRSLLKSLVGLGALAAAPARAARPTGQRRLGVLLFDRAESWDSLPPLVLKELAALGWIEGSNLDVQWRYANGDPAMLETLAAQLVKSGVDAILTRGTPATRALQQATTTVPIVTGLGDPVGFGFAKTLAQPGGNVTGISYAVVEASRKHVELLRAMVPKLATLLVVWPKNGGPFTKELTRGIEDAAREMRVTPRVTLVDNAADLRAALATDHRPGEFAAFVAGLGSRIEPKTVADLAIASQVPTMFDYRFYVDAGGLASYRFDWDNQVQRSAAQLDKVFRGEKPAEIPFEFPTRSEFVLNLATARALGLTLPQALILRADATIQ